MEEEAKSFLKTYSLIFTSLSYSYFIVSKIPPGKFRLFSLLPIFTLFTILPFSFSSVLLAGITALFITWLGNFKLLLYAFNHGPLSNHQPIKNLSFLQFLLISAFPIKIKDPFTRIRKPTSKFLPLNFWSETLIFSIFVGICDFYKQNLNHGLIFVIYCCMLYLFIDIIMSVSNTIVGSIMGFELFPPSDEPYLSSSISDFWGRRWNLMVTDILRHTVYKPTRVFLSNYIGRDWASVISVIAAFVVSGLMHELIFYYMARVSPSWEVTWFFVLHGLCVVLEFCLKKVLGRKLGLHWVITGPLTVGFVMGTGYLWFFPPLVMNKVDVRAIEEAMTLYEFIKGKLKKML
ncbi:long-chain-alcohol O-fatty-acyltransferase-like [Amaranthus tricolor]|uniref:long-chain-alcohol O-fatty-acyltransferase-like n=1 Tax=Amaranthus tricolor TaxID=29722 RepID=UPI00258D36D3|nr:long-chain-alcohol O-fatty-acyltransferase-like [Amaranthus tricolor]